MFCFIKLCQGFVRCFFFARFFAVVFMCNEHNEGNDKKLQTEESSRTIFNTWTYINFMQLHNYLNVFLRLHSFSEKHENIFELLSYSFTLLRILTRKGLRSEVKTAASFRRRRRFVLCSYFSLTDDFNNTNALLENLTRDGKILSSLLGFNFATPTRLFPFVSRTTDGEEDV